jgi:hypothetical protein
MQHTSPPICGSKKVRIPGIPLKIVRIADRSWHGDVMCMSVPHALCSLGCKIRGRTTLGKAANKAMQQGLPPTVITSQSRAAPRTLGGRLSTGGRKEV